MRNPFVPALPSLPIAASGSSPARVLAQALAAEALAVCRHYLPAGCRIGNYWQVGDATNTAGRSLFVRLSGSAAGKWTDAATGEHGDMLDLIRLNREFDTLAETLAEARRFLNCPARPAGEAPFRERSGVDAARRLFAAGRPIAGTLAEGYLRARGLGAIDAAALRFHPRCFLRDGARRLTRPALLTAVEDGEGRLTGIQRTYLAADGRGKAAVDGPVRALGRMHGGGACFGLRGRVLVAGEGLESVLSVRCLNPDLPCVAALAAAHLPAIPLPAGLARLYIAVDVDAAGRRAAEALRRRAEAHGIVVRELVPSAKDWNDVLVRDGRLRAADLLRRQLMPDDGVAARV